MNHFWEEIPAYAKWDELEIDRHMHLLEPVLKDVDTGVEQFERHEYILYGPEQALLFRPKTLIPRLAMSLYTAMMGLFGRN